MDSKSVSYGVWPPSILKLKIMGVKMDENIYKILGRKVREERKRAGLTLDALAERAEISGAFVAHIEAGRKNASLDTVTKLAHALGLSLGEMLGESGNSHWEKNQAHLKGLSRLLRNKTPDQKQVLVKLVETACGLIRK